MVAALSNGWDRVRDAITLAVVAVLLIWHLVDFIRLGPVKYVLMFLEAFSMLAPG